MIEYVKSIESIEAEARDASVPLTVEPSRTAVALAIIADSLSHTAPGSRPHLEWLDRSYRHAARLDSRPALLGPLETVWRYPFEPRDMRPARHGNAV